MTLNAFTWATNTNYSAGPDTGTPTKVNPASTANGFVSGTIAAPQHVNYLYNLIAAELLKAIDGAGGGTYTLAAPLRFEGADVQIAGHLEVVSGGEINVQSGGWIDVESGGDINVLSGGDINVQSGGELSIGSGGALDVLAGGAVNLASGATLQAARGQDLTISSETITLELCLTPVTVSSSGGAPVWDFRSDLGSPQRWSWIQLNAGLATRRPLVLAVPVREGDVITDFDVFVDGDLGSGAPHGGLPGTMPKVELVRLDSLGQETVIHSETDGSVSQPVYDSGHVISPTSPANLPHTVTSSQRIYLMIYGEAGANSEDAYLGVYRSRVTVTRNSMLGTGTVEYV